MDHETRLAKGLGSPPAHHRLIERPRLRIGFFRFVKRLMSSALYAPMNGERADHLRRQQFRPNRITQRAPWDTQAIKHGLAHALRVGFASNPSNIDHRMPTGRFFVYPRVPQEMTQRREKVYFALVHAPMRQLGLTGPPR
jgi:hypothetical protein